MRICAVFSVSRQSCSPWKKLHCMCIRHWAKRQITSWWWCYEKSFDLEVKTERVPGGSWSRWVIGRLDGSMEQVSEGETEGFSGRVRLNVPVCGYGIRSFCSETNVQAMLFSCFCKIKKKMAFPANSPLNYKGTQWTWMPMILVSCSSLSHKQDHTKQPRSSAEGGDMRKWSSTGPPLWEQHLQVQLPWQLLLCCPSMVLLRACGLRWGGSFFWNEIVSQLLCTWVSVPTGVVGIQVKTLTAVDIDATLASLTV